MGREWWKNFLFAPFSVEIGSEFFFFNDPLAVLLLTSLQNPPSRPFSNLTSSLLHVCVIQGPPSSIALVSGSTAYNASHCPSFQTRRVAPPRLELSLREGKIKAQAHGQDWDDEPPEVHTDEEEPCGWGNAGRCDIRGGGGRNAETRCRRISVGEALTGFR